MLAALSSGQAAGRVAVLLHQLGVGRASLRRTLDALDGQGLAGRNSGYGHPLRPELILTDRGRRLGLWCERVVAAAKRAGASDVAIRKWSMAVLLALHEGCERFSEIELALEGLTARALTQALRHLATAGLVERVVYDDIPPSVRYRLTTRGRTLARLASAAPID